MLIPIVYNDFYRRIIAIVFSHKAIQPNVNNLGIFSMNRRHFLLASTLIPGGLAAMPTTNRIQFLSPSIVAAPIGNYNHVAVVPAGYDMIALAGQVGNALDGSVPPELEKQYENALTNIVRLLESQGCTPANIVKVNYYLVRPLDPEKIRGVRPRLLGDIKPPSTLIYVPRLASEEYLIEIEVWAARPPLRR
jgi:2-iminobutanoate/2-iminopropanoate deaminase